MFKNFKGKMNGVDIVGRSVTVVNGQVFVDDVDVTPDAKNITIEITGDVENLNVDTCRQVTINGNAQTVETAAGDDRCHDVNGPVETISGDIKCGNVQGNVKTVSGDVECDNVGGNVSSKAGDIIHS